MKSGRKGKIAIYNRDFLHKTTLLRFLLIEISKKTVFYEHRYIHE